MALTVLDREIQGLLSNDLKRWGKDIASQLAMRVNSMTVGGKAGLEANGEQSVENLAFKLLRARGQIDKLRKYINKLTSAELSLGEQNEDQ